MDCKTRIILENCVPGIQNYCCGLWNYSIHGAILKLKFRVKRSWEHVHAIDEGDLEM